MKDESDKSIWVILGVIFFAVWIVVGLVGAYNDRMDCSVPSNFEEPLCQPDEPDTYTGFDPDAPGEPYDGGDWPAP